MLKRPWLNFGMFVPMLAALLLVIAVSCGGSATSTAAPQPTAVPAAAATAVPAAAATATTAPVAMAEGPTGTLNLAFREMGPYHGHPSNTGNPSYGHVTLAAYEGLAFRNADSVYVPQLAESWSIAPDNVTWTFKLNKGVQFHGGWGEMTADDVIWSISEFAAEGSISATAGQVGRAFLNPDGHMIALDDHTVEVNTGIPQWDIPAWIATPGVDGTFIVNKQQVAELIAEVGLDAANSQLVGTGPWENTDHQTGEFWKFDAVEDHYRKTPFFAKMVFHEIPEESTRIANFQVGKIDTFNAAPDTLPALAEIEGTKFMSQQGVAQSHLGLYGSWYIGVGTDDQRPGFDPNNLPYVSSSSDVNSAEWERARKVREAMAISIDRDKIIDELLGGEGEHLTMWGYMGSEHRELPEWKWVYDLEKAKQLMKDAGQEDGFDVDITPAIRGAPAEVEACEAVADMWADIGITAHIQRIPYGTIRPQFAARTYEGVSCHSVAAYPEPLVIWSFMWDPTGFWNSGLEHPFLEPARKTANDTFDTEERWKLQNELGSFLWDNVLDIGLYSQNNIYPLGPKLDPWTERLGTADARRLSGLEWAPHRK